VQLPVLFLFIGGFALDLAGQRSPRIIGMVRLPPGETAYPDIMNVSLRTIDGGFVSRLTLLGQTSFVFERLQRNQYRVVVESPGFKSGSALVDLVGPYSSPEQSVVVQLGQRIVEGPDVPDGGQDQTVSVAALRIPPKAQRELDRAAAASAKQQTEKAIGYLLRALEIEPTLYQAHNNLAVEYMRLGRLADAAAALEESVRLRPDEPTSLSNLAHLHVAMQRWDRAEELSRKALELKPDYPDALNTLGEVHIAFGKFDQALDYFLRASELNPDQRAYIGIGQCYSLLGRLEEALLEFEEFHKRFPDDPRISSVQIIIAQIKQDLVRE
jgi:tetratricopeptide (TPR) repeat protein